MTDIEQRARNALNAAADGYIPWNIEDTRQDYYQIEAMCREIEAHDATKAELADFKREVSEAVKAFANVSWTPDTCKAQWNALVRFIQPDPVKVDPLLIEARKIAAQFYIEAGGGYEPNVSAEVIRRGEGDNTIACLAALAGIKRGLTITEGDAK